MPTELKVNAHLTGKICLQGTAHTGATVNLDYPAPLGEDQGFMPLEMLLLSLAGCSGHTVLLLLRKMRQPVESLAVEATGTRRDEHPTVFTRIEVRFTIIGQGVEPAAVERALKMSEEQLCPVWAMLKPSVEIVPAYQIESLPERAPLPERHTA
jgi:putative redox protein